MCRTKRWDGQMGIGQPHLLTIVQTRRFSLFGHIHWTLDETDAKKILTASLWRTAGVHQDALVLSGWRPSNRTFADRASAAVGPGLWNSLRIQKRRTYHIIDSGGRCELFQLCHLQIISFTYIPTLGHEVQQLGLVTIKKFLIVNFLKIND